nr:hypothetical protein [uncultured Brevundimonas sp.]
MRYGLCMAGNGDETGAGGMDAGWLDHVRERLTAKVEQAVQALCSTDARNGVAEAEKLARAAGVIARAAKAVDALKSRSERKTEEDEMGGEHFDPEEDERLRAELCGHYDRVERILEEKRAEAAERIRAKARAAPLAGGETPD